MENDENMTTEVLDSSTLNAEVQNGGNQHAEVADRSQNAGTQNAAPLNEQPKRPVPPKGEKKMDKGKKAWLIALIALLLAAGIGGGVYYFLSQKSNNTEMSDEEDEEEIDDDDADEPDDTGDTEDADDPSDTDDTDGTEGTDDAEAQEAPSSTTHIITEDDVAAAISHSSTRKLVLKGDADGYLLTLTLETDANHKVTGTYHNETDGTTMNVTGTNDNGTIRLTGKKAGIIYTFRIVPEGNIFTGTLSTRNKNRELHLTKAN